MLDHVTISVIDKRNTKAMTNTNGAIKYSCVKLIHSVIIAADRTWSFKH